MLGSGSLLTPLPANAAQHQRNTSLLSPSESTLSLSSQTSTSQTSAQAQEDSGSKVEVGSFGRNAAATASSRLVCPICNEEMVSQVVLRCDY